MHGAAGFLIFLMYDRKTWIVVAVCAVLLAVNLFFQQKNAERAAEQRQAEASELGETLEERIPEEVGSLEEMPPAEPVVDATTVSLETGETVFTLTTLGGGVRTAELVHQRAIRDENGHVILNERGRSPVGALASGPDRMETVNYAYREDLSVPGESVVFLGRHPSGLVVKKTWAKVAGDEPGSDYLLDFKLEVENPVESGNRLPLDDFSLFLGRAVPLHARELTPSGVFWREDESFHFIKATKDGKLKRGLFGGESMIAQTEESIDYVGVSSQLFATALRPMEKTNGGFWSKGFSAELDDEERALPGARAGYTLPSVTLEPGSRESFNFRVFMGPKDNRMLRQMGGGWGDMMNYGWFSVFSRFMNFLLVHIHDVVAKVAGPWSWGWAIIIVTIVVRAMMWPLYARSNRTMKRMGKLKPEMDRLKEKYPDDPAKMQQEVMMLYRKFGINPVGGCLPMLVQIPIFFGFYRMLQYAVELRGQDFLWVNDLSMPDTVGYLFGTGIPINVLPIVMGLSSFAQIAMMPNASADKTQQTIMKLMPLMFFFFCYNFAAALALYWTTSNLFSIFQTWLTQRMPEPELEEKPGGAGKSFMEKMAAAAEAQQKMKKARGRVVEEEDDTPKKKRGPRTGG